MTRELVDRMRTCAAAIEASKETGNPWDLALVGSDAARLLRIAADALEEPEPAGEPMEVLTTTVGGIDREPSPSWTGGVGKPVWGGYEVMRTIPISIGTFPCPACGSIDARAVKRIGRCGLRLTCPACRHQWEYGT